MSSSLPPPEPNSENCSLYQELKKRKVFQVAGTYMVVGWLVIQITVAVFPQFDIPVWASRFVILLVAAGFPIALVLAWAFELTPAGMKTTRRARAESQGEPASQAVQRKRTGLAILFGALMPTFAVGIILGAVAIWYVQQRSDQKAVPTPMASISEVAAAATAPVAETRPVVAIMPFLNMSPDAENAFFADGVHEDLLTNLSRISQLRVVARTSVMGYASERPSLRQIAEELQASHIVEGSVRRFGGRVRITAQLIDAHTAENLWANRFDRDLDDIFAIQGQVADEIASALQAELSPAERARLLNAPTRSVEAYDLFLKARELNRARDRQGENLVEGIELLRRAVAIDANFADAWSLLAWYHASCVHFRVGDAETQLADADAALDRAQALAPGHPNTLLAEAYVLYHGRQDYEGSLVVLARALALEPESSEVLAAEAFVLRRLGRFRDSLDRLWEAIRVDPRNSSLLQQTLIQVQAMGQPQQVLEIARRLAAFYPDDTDLQDLIFGMEMTLRPNPPRIRKWVKDKERELEQSKQIQNFEAVLQLASIHLIFGEVDQAAAISRFENVIAPEARAPFRAALANMRYRHALFIGDERAADEQLAALEGHLREVEADRSSSDLPDEFHAMFLGWLKTMHLTVALHRGDREKARAYLDAIASLLHSNRDNWSLFSGGNLRAHHTRARIFFEPEKAYEIYREEQARELPGLSFWSVAPIPLEFPMLLRDPRFQREVALHPDLLAFLREVAPQHLD